MKAHLINMHLLVPRSRSSAKVKVEYQCYISQKMAILGALVFHKHILSFCLCSLDTINMTSLFLWIKMKYSLFLLTCLSFCQNPASKSSNSLSDDKTLDCTLTHSHTMTPFDAPGKQAFCKHCGKRRNCL